MKHLIALSDRDLQTLVAGLRSSRLSAPFTELSVRRVLGDTGSIGLMSDLRTLSDRGLSDSALVELLEVLLADRNSRRALKDDIDLVTTGPEAPGIVNRDTGVVVRELFVSAQRSVLVAGFAIYQGRDVFKALAERMQAEPSLNVRLFLDIQRGQGDTTVAPALVARFAQNFRQKQWPVGAPLPQLFYDPRSLDIGGDKRACLHAKCIVVDGETVFVSSANFTEAAQERNIEVGLLLRSKPTAEQLTGYFDTLAAHELVLAIPFSEQRPAAP